MGRWGGFGVPWIRFTWESATASLLLLGAGLLAIPAPDALAAPQPRTSERVASDEATAGRLARRLNEPVEIKDAHTETSRSWALPDGSVKVDTHIAPEWVADGAGGWKQTDVTLKARPDGTVTPGAHPLQMSLAGERADGTHDVVTVGSGPRQVAVGWRGRLPQPELDGPTATYRDVEPGIDLVVEALTTGFEYFIVIKNRAAASRLTSVAMPWRTGELAATPTTDGGIELKTAAGETVGSLPLAEMWDATVSPRTGEHPRRAPVRMYTQPQAGWGTDLVLTPDKAFLTDPRTVYPVTVDPPVTLKPAFDTFVQTGISSDQSASKDLKLGYVVEGGPYKARSFMSFTGLSRYAGATVLSAELFLWNYHSWSCRKAQWQAWRVGAVGASVRWSKQPKFIQLAGVSTGTKGYAGCDDGWVSVNVKKVFQPSLTNGDNAAYVGLKASSETSQRGWKRFRSAQAPSHRPYVSLVYNRKPKTPTSQSVTDCFVRCASPAVVSRRDPELRVKATDPDGGPLTIRYEVYNTALVRFGQVTGYASGSASPARWRIAPAVPTDGWYRWRARACDANNFCSGWTGWFEFTTDSAAPAPPTVRPVDPEKYFEDDDSGASSGAIGMPGELEFTGAADVDHFRWQLDGSPFDVEPAEGTTVKTARVTVIPGNDMIRTVTVEAYDAAGRKGVTTYRFNVASPEPEAAHWQLDGSGEDELGGHSLVTTGVTWVAGRTADAEGSAAHFDGDESVQTQRPVLATGSVNPEDARRSFAVSAWVQLTDISRDRVVVSQMGTHRTMFQLGYQADAGRLCFSVFHADAPAATATRACATRPPALGQWTHLAGVLDLVQRKVHLYVNGGVNLKGEAISVAYSGTPFPTTGPLIVGRGWTGGAPTAPWLGDIDEVWAYQRVLTEEEIEDQALLTIEGDA